MQGDVNFSSGEVMLIAALLGAMVSALGVVFHAWQRAVAMHIEELNELIDRLEHDRNFWRSQAEYLLRLSRDILSMYDTDRDR